MLTDGRTADDGAAIEGPVAARNVAIRGRRGRRGRPVRVGRLVSAVVVVAGGVWWLWPTLAGSDADVDVLVVAGDGLVDARRSIELRMREAGLSVEWHDATAACATGAVTALVEAADPARVVVDPAAGSGCLDAVAGSDIDPDRVLVVAPFGIAAAQPAIAGLDVVEGFDLLGPPGGAVTMPCEWWEQPCPPDGVGVRAPDGTLTEAGHERLARVLVASL